MGKKVKCIDCGCLGTPKGEPGSDPWFAVREYRGANKEEVYSPTLSSIGYIELSEPDRRDLRARRIPIWGTAHHPRLKQRPPACARGILVFERPAVFETLDFCDYYDTARECPHFIKYVPGFSPQQHIEEELRLKREKDHRSWENKQKMKWMLIGIPFTIITAIIVQVIIWYFQLLPPR